MPAIRKREMSKIRVRDVNWVPSLGSSISVPMEDVNSQDTLTGCSFWPNAQHQEGGAAVKYQMHLLFSCGQTGS